MANTFELQLAKFAEKAGDNARQVIRKVSIDCLTKVVLRTPVGNPSLWKSKPPAGYVGGRLRANWNVSFGNPNFTVSQKIDRTGDATITAGRNTINRAYGDNPIYIMNSMPYVREIEYEGHSKQAPAGMVRITVTEFQTFIDQAVAGLPK